jgi:hypothetical protein
VAVLFITSKTERWYAARVHIGLRGERGRFVTRCAVRHNPMRRVTLREFKKNPCRLCLAMAFASAT